MIIRRNIFLILGGVFTVLNLLFYIVVLLHPNEQLGIDPADRDKPGFMFGHYLGLNLFLILGLLFFFLAYRVNKKIKAKKRQEMLESF